MRVDVEKEIERILPLIPKEPPQNTIEILKKRGYLKDERLLYRIAYGIKPMYGTIGPGGKSVAVRCSRCGGRTYLEYAGNDQGCYRGGATYGFIDPLDRSAVRSGGTCVCPMCGVGLRALHIGEFKSWMEIDSRICMSVHNVEGHLAILSWVIRKRLHTDGSVSYHEDGYEGIVVIEKTLVRIKMYSKFMSSYSWSSEWSYTKRYDDQLGTFEKSEIVEVSPIVVERTECAHSAFAEYLSGGGELNPGRYLKLWLKHPNVENLARQGFSRYVSEVIKRALSYNGSYYRTSFEIKNTDQYIDWSKVKPSEMLGLQKDELAIARSVSFDALEFYREIKERKGIRLDAETLNKIEKWGFYSVKTMVCTPINGYSVPLIRSINYLEKQRKGAPTKDLVSVRYLEDYWNALYNVYRSMPPELLYPKDLQRAHDEMVLRVKEKEDAEINAKISERLTELSSLSYENNDMGLMIRPAASQAELIKEGKILHHCVGGYAKAHADGKTTILFIRKIDDPDIPFYTLEFKNGKVLQNRGDRNCARTKEVIDFENDWLEHIKNKEFMNNGKRSSRNQERIRAGA